MPESTVKEERRERATQPLDEIDGRPNLGSHGSEPPKTVHAEPHETSVRNVEDGIDDFAEDVILGLTDAGLDVSMPAPMHDEPTPRLQTNHDASRHEVPAQSYSQPVESQQSTSGASDHLLDVQSHDPLSTGEGDIGGFEAFFAGWDGPDSLDLEPDLESTSPDAGFDGGTSLNDMSVMSYAGSDLSSSGVDSRQKPVNGTVNSDVREIDEIDAVESKGRDGRPRDQNDSKHDALADAVQDALLSVYGVDDTKGSEALRGLKIAGSPNAKDAASSGVGVAQKDDNLSPQDIILNYFDYNVTTSLPDRAATSPGSFAPVAIPAGDLQAAVERKAAQAASFAAKPVNKAPVVAKNPQIPADDGQLSRKYEGAPAFPMPARVETFPAKSAKDNGRLLGAAGIGLIGGIAIAATLAVFIINSYGPIAPAGSNIESAPSGRRLAEAPPQGNAPAVRQGKGPATPNVASVLLANNVKGEPGQPVTLAISVQSAKPSDQTLVSLTGVPEGVRLNVGIDAGGGNWLLPPKRLNGLTLTVPEQRNESFSIEAQLLDSNGRAPLSDKKQFSVELSSLSPAKREPDAAPAASSPPSAVVSAEPRADAASTGLAAADRSNPQGARGFDTKTVTIPQSQPPEGERAPAAATTEITRQPAQTAAAPAAVKPAEKPVAVNPEAQADVEDQIREGNKRMRDGDILQARAFYARVAGNGDPDAALAMGRSYDPIYFERLDKKNAEPDAAKAFDWYKQAMDRGATQTAKMRIDNLTQYLNR